MKAKIIENYSRLAENELNDFLNANPTAIITNMAVTNNPGQPGYNSEICIVILFEDN